MTPTREQLELAAKAAGIVPYSINAETGAVKYKVPSATMAMQFSSWFPTTSKSDSFDLMVACGINVQYGLTRVWARWADDMDICVSSPMSGGTKVEQTTMWAIFLCAVEIGRAM
jgi:hypothetical protein